jgi:hypothetical protein
MNKKKWALLLLCVVLIFGYIKLFYKSYSNNVVAQNADCIVAIDVKRITNTLIWNVITTPSQWKPGNIFKRSTGKGEVGWKDMIAIPDYIFGFHVKGQPLNTWYTVLTIKDAADFDKGLSRYHFTTQNNNTFTSEELGLRFYRFNNQILLSNSKKDDGYLDQTATSIFVNKSYVAKPVLQQAIDAKSHAAIYLAANSYLQEDAMVTANFDKQKINIDCSFTPAGPYNFTEQPFDYTDSSLFFLGFTQPPAAIYNLISDSSKAKISKAVNFNIDSVLWANNKKYILELSGFWSRTDSAITYSYDDDFNKIEQVVVNNVTEPAYRFNISGDSISKIYNYLINSGKLEQTDAGQLFTPVPFVKSYCNISSQYLLNIQSANYLPQQSNKTSNGILFLQLILAKIPADLQKYLPGNIKNAISNLESMKITTTKKDNKVVVNCTLQKKNNDLMIIKL